MDMANTTEILQAIAEYVAKFGGPFSLWYAGIAADPQSRLFSEHGVDKHKDAWIYRLCDSSSDARAIETYLIQRGMKGGPGGGDNTTRSIYAYRMTASTRE